MTPAVRRLLREHGLTAGADRRDGRRWADHPRRRHELRRVPANRAARRRPVAAAAAAVAADAAAPARRPPPAARLPPTGPRPLQRRDHGTDAAPRDGRAPGAAPAAGRGLRWHVDQLPRWRRRSPRPADPDAQGHRGPDDAGAPGTARLRPDGGRRHPARRLPREGQARLPGEGGDRAQLRPVRRQGVGRGAQAQPDVQRHLDRAGSRRQAPRQHRGCGRGRRRPDRAGHPRRRPAVDPRPERRDRRRRGPGQGRQVQARRLRRRNVHGRQHRATSVRTS